MSIYGVAHVPRSCHVLWVNCLSVCACLSVRLSNMLVYRWIYRFVKTLYCCSEIWATNVANKCLKIKEPIFFLEWTTVVLIVFVFFQCRLTENGTCRVPWKTDGVCIRASDIRWCHFLPLSWCWHLTAHIFECLCSCKLHLIKWIRRLQWWPPQPLTGQTDWKAEEVEDICPGGNKYA